MQIYTIAARWAGNGPRGLPQRWPELYYRAVSLMLVSEQNIGHFVLFLTAHLAATIVVMLPITWTYSATRFEAGPSSSFVQTLLLMPLRAATVVLLVQDSLALAFGLAAGIVYLGAAMILALFFCLTNAILWETGYGRNPVDERALDVCAWQVRH